MTQSARFNLGWHMKTVVRLALAYFDMVPLQRWLTGIGFGLFVLGLLLPAAAMIGVMLLGVALIVLTPAMAGGVALRYASTRSALQLRPHGRGKLLLSALLAITFMALLVSLPWWLMEHLPLRHGTNHPLEARSADVLLSAWSLIGLVWLAVFIASRSHLTFITLLLLYAFHNSYIRQRWHLPLPNALGLVWIAILAWIVFAAWYLRTGEVKRTSWMAQNSPDFDDANNGVLPNLFRRKTRVSDNSRAAAIRAYLLGTQSLAGYLILGLGVLLLALALQWRAGSSGSATGIPVFYMPAFSLVSASMGYMVVRRARLLWLRAGLVRADLLTLSETTGLVAIALSLGSAVLVATLVSSVTRPELTASVVIISLLQIPHSLGLFYLGLSATRGWTADEVIIAIAAGALLLVEMIVLAPEPTPRYTASIVFLAVSLVLFFLFRHRARRRWREVDWRVVRPPTGFRS